MSNPPTYSTIYLNMVGLSWKLSPTSILDRVSAGTLSFVLIHCTIRLAFKFHRILSICFNYYRISLFGEYPFFMHDTTVMLSHHKRIQVSFKCGWSTFSAFIMALNSRMCIHSSYSVLVNCPRTFRRLASSGWSSLDEPSTLSLLYTTPWVEVSAHFPCICAPHAKPDASVDNTTCRMRVFALGPQGRPMSAWGGFDQ